jgi:hypothetical protein
VGAATAVVEVIELITKDQKSHIVEEFVKILNFSLMKMISQLCEKLVEHDSVKDKIKY